MVDGTMLVPGDEQMRVATIFAADMTVPTGAAPGPLAAPTSSATPTFITTVVFLIPFDGARGCMV